MEQLIGQTFKHYQIQDIVGQGGMGVVYKAHDLAQDREVALKVLHPHLAQRPGFQERFLEEARIAKSLEHPGLVKTYEVGQEGTWLYMVMPFIAGVNLRQMLMDMQQASRQLPLNKVVVLMRLLCQAVGYAHSRGVLHGDIKPSNVIIVSKPASALPYYPVLTDMGLARTFEAQEETPQVSKGTPAYMAPEVALGQQAGTYSDVYSLGALLYELVIGRPPYEVHTVAEAARAHAQGAPPAPCTVRPDLPVALETVILKALAREPGQRFADANVMAAALETANASLPKTTTTVVDTGATVASLSRSDQTGSSAPAVTMPYKTPVDEASDFTLPAGRAFSDSTPVDEEKWEEIGPWYALSIDPYVLTVEPGDFADASVTLSNHGPTSDSLTLSVAGVPGSWVNFSPTVRLAPGQQQAITLSISPPDDPQSRAGQYPLTIRAVSQSEPAKFAETQAVLTVKAVSRFASELHPARVYAGRPGQVTVHNQGNVEETFTLQWTNPEDALVFTPPQTPLTVLPGETKQVEFRGKPHKRRWTGGETDYPFSVRVRAASSGDAQIYAGELLSKGQGAVLTLITVLLLCLMPFLLWRLLPPEIQNSIQAGIPLSMASDTPTPASTATPVLAPTQETVVPSPAPPFPTPVISSEEAVRDYYALVGQEQYTYAYPMVKEYDLRGKKQSLDEYVAGWTESGPATISRVIDVQEAGNAATITLELYYTNKGVYHTLRYRLERNYELGNERFGYWLFMKGELIK